ncbi:hypothetical protein MNBD_NITROSPIRAE03-257 [hydrothermal vent metagenome]|uniref:HigB toxin protein n=1 Tax=hydrothermal vent metagenome TaxID=652676 RepID=A0A3B1DZS8_9ZZZZ
MQIEFRNRHLVHLYQKGKAGKYPLPPGVINKFFMRMQQIEAAVNIYDLWKTSSLNFERLQGFENRFSLRLDNKYRLEIEIEWEDEKRTKGIVYILEISKHYGD